MVMPLAAYNDPNPVAEVVLSNDCTIRVTLMNRGDPNTTNKIWFSGTAKTALSLRGGNVPSAAYLLPNESVTLETSDSIYATAEESGQVLQVIVETI